MTWYFVQGSERVGPVEKEEINGLFREGTLTPDSYVWRKGFDNWKSLNTVDEFDELLSGAIDDSHQRDEDNEISEIPQMNSFGEEKDVQEAPAAFDINKIGEHEKVFTIKVGYDRGGSETEYGPFSIQQLKKAYDENRINEKTFIFTPGMNTWVLLGDFDLFEVIAGDLPPSITEDDRRINVRKPFIARLFFHDNNQVYEGICRDISVGGLQILVSDFPCNVGDDVAMNVHPDNTDYHFTASGTVVRLLEGNSGFSLRFMDLANDAKDAIKNYINEN